MLGSAALLVLSSGVFALPQVSTPATVRVFLDCTTGCFADYVRSEVTFVDYVRDRAEADVHVIVTSSETGSGGREYTAAFIGAGPFAGTDHSLKAVTTSSDPEDVVRRQVTTMLRIGLLNYVARGGVPQRLSVDVEVELDPAKAATAAGQDRWNKWVFSVQGSVSMQAEESNSQTEWGGSLSADRITPDWKTTLGLEVDNETEHFDLDEEDPVRVERRERDFSWLVVKGLGEHWSIGAEGGIESSTFNNTALSIRAAPAVEFNVFPYSAYTRRQLRVQYAVGAERVRYYEETLFGETEEVLPQHMFSVTFDQRERWGTVEASVEAFQYLHDLEKSRLEADGEVSWRLARGFSVSAQGRASRIQDQLSLPRRGATQEEILLRLRELQSGYEYDFSLSLTYTFGSIFSSIVNPRFGQ
jgi:hypothetical protein